jgi:hypothetical protein
MSIRANVSILFNPLSRIVKSKVFNLKMDEHSSESFARIFILLFLSVPRLPPCQEKTKV